MKFLDKVKSLFKKKKHHKKHEEEKTEEPKKEDEFQQAIERSELYDILNSVKINNEDLALDRIESEADTITNYVKGLIKNLSNYNDFKNDKDRIEESVRGIAGKIKQVAIHGLELKNLLANLEDHYYKLVIETLKKANEKAKNEDLDNLIKTLEEDLRLVQDLDAQLTKVAGYDGLFNPDKNTGYKEEIEKEAAKRIVHGDLNDLLDRLLNTVVNKSIGVKNKIENSNPLEEAKKFV